MDQPKRTPPPPRSITPEHRAAIEAGKQKANAARRERAALIAANAQAEKPAADPPEFPAKRRARNTGRKTMPQAQYDALIAGQQARREHDAANGYKSKTAQMIEKAHKAAEALSGETIEGKMTISQAATASVLKVFVMFLADELVVTKATEASKIGETAFNISRIIENKPTGITTTISERALDDRLKAFRQQSERHLSLSRAAGGSLKGTPAA